MAVYARILRAPGLAVLIGATMVTRLPFAINGLAVILFMREQTGSFAIAGLVAGALAIGAATGAPLAGRLVDRRGPRMLMPLAGAHAIAVLAIWLLGSTGAPIAAVAVAAFAAGAAFPPAGALLRSRFSQLLDDDDDLVHGAYALDSVNIELSFVTGPLITAVLVAVAGAELALGVSAVLVLAGTALFVSRLPGAREAPEHAAHTGILGALGDPAIRMVALSTFPVGFCIGAIEVALPAFSAEHGSPALAGVLLALWSAASGIGGLAWGLRSARRGPVEAFLAIALLFPLACLPLAAASSPLAMAVLVLLAGAPIAPLIASRNQLVGLLTPLGSGAEAFTWLMTALVSGAAIGSAISGALIEADGWPAAVLLGCAVATIGAGLALLFRGVLHPRIATG